MKPPVKTTFLFLSWTKCLKDLQETSTIVFSMVSRVTFKFPSIRKSKKTTLMYPYRTFAYRRMPFGSCNAPSTFQRYMMAIFHDMIEKTMEVFMDNFSVFGISFRTCLSHPEKMLKRCEDTNLCLNWEKSHFMVKEGIILSHKISKNGIEVDKSKVDVIAKLPYPTTVKSVVLGKRHEKHFRHIHYASKTMTEAESNYTTTEIEMLAVVYAFEKFWSYLIMNKSIVYTNHSALKYLFAKKDSKIKSLGGMFMARKPLTFLRIPTINPSGDIMARTTLPRRFGTLRAIISDRETHFCKHQFAKVMLKYGVTHRLATTYHPQISRQVEVLNRGLKRTLEKTVGENRASCSEIAKLSVFATIEFAYLDDKLTKEELMVSTNGPKYYFSGSDQIQTPQYPNVHPPSQEISDEVFQAKGDLMKSIQTFLEEFNYIPFGEKPKILLQDWDKFFAIQHAKPEDSNELFQTLLEDLQIIKKELTEYNHPTFFNDNEDHLENSSNEIATLRSNLEKEGPPQDSDIHHLIREECCIEVCEEQNQNMEDTILELVEMCRQKELLYEIIKSGVEELVPILSENEVTLEDKRECDLPVCKKSPICDDHSEIFFDSNNDDDISSDKDSFEDIEYVEASLFDPKIVSVEEENVVHQEEEEIDLKDIFQIQDVVLREKLLSINHLIANIESLNDNPTPDRMLNSSALIPIFEEFDNSLSDNFLLELETFCDHTKETRSGNTITHADDSLPEYDSFCFEIEPDQERLINVVKNDFSNDSSNDSLLEEADLFLASDNSIPPGIENFAYDSEWDIRFLEALLIDDSIPINESPESDFDNPSFPRPPSEPPDADVGEEILVVMNTIDELECLDPIDEFDDDDYSSFMFIIYPKVFSLLLFAESEDTIFDPVISV
nr:retrovirus-related Pol polyprotein from transposon 17.6 [Tanacetum cinerariifolium]